MATKPPFGFDYLYKYMQSLANNDTSKLHPYQNRTVPALAFDACVAAVGTVPGPYSRQDVYDRVLLWRVPLIALWATTTLPALGPLTKAFTLLHLVADPIDTLWSLLYKLDLAKCTAEWSTEPERLAMFTFEDEEEGEEGDEGEEGEEGEGEEEEEEEEEEEDGDGDDDRTEHPQDENRLIRVRTTLAQFSPRMEEMDFSNPDLKRYICDAIASIITAYDEWGYGAEALKAINHAFNMERWRSVTHRSVLRERCAITAFFVASDRVSRILPSAISTLVFLVQIFAGFWKILVNISDTYDDTNPISNGLNRAPHNIAFGVLFFWLPLAVLMTALVGGSQTAHLMPRVLDSFQRAVKTAQEDSVAENIPLDPQSEVEKLPDISPTQKHKRWSHGGLPVWQLAKFADFKDSKHWRFWILGLSTAFIAVAVPTGCAIAISWLTPTEGFGCRGMTQLAFLFMWVFNLSTDWVLYKFLSASGSDLSRSVQTLPAPGRSERVYYITLAKDSFFFTATVLTLTGSALGMFNSCNCWSKWFPLRSVGYISFPQEDYIFRLIKDRLSTTFPIIVGGALVTQIVIYGAVRIYFHKGHRVLKQRDIDEVLETSDSRRPQKAPTLDFASQNPEETTYPLTDVSRQSG